VLFLLKAIHHHEQLWETHGFPHQRTPFKCVVFKFKHKEYQTQNNLIRHYRNIHPPLFIEEMNRRKSKSISKPYATSRCYFCSKRLKELAMSNSITFAHVLEFGYICEFSPCSQRGKTPAAQSNQMRKCQFNPYKFMCKVQTKGIYLLFLQKNNSYKVLAGRSLTKSHKWKALQMWSMYKK